MTEVNDRPIVTKAQAREQGLKRFFTGKLCIRNHLSERNINSGRCISCGKENSLIPCRKLRKENWGKYKEYQKKHNKKQKEASLKWRNNNPKKVMEYKKQDYQRHKENYRKHGRAYRTRKANAIGSHTVLQVLELIKKQGNRCAECKCKISMEPRGVEVKAHLDHITPLKLNGSNDIGNLQFLCWHCNISKNATHPIEWARKKGRLL